MMIWLCVLCFETSCKVNRRNANLRIKNRYSSGKIALKLILILGTAELLGFIQIVRDDLSHEEKVYNDIIKLMYVMLRSFKGTLIAGLYFLKEKNIQCNPKKNK